MNLQINPAAITQYWYMIEQLTLFNLDKVEADFGGRVSDDESDSALPWMNSEILAKKIQSFNKNKQEKNKLDKNKVEYQVFLGVFSSSLVSSFIKSLPKKTEVGFKDVENQKLDSCYASIKIDKDGLLIEWSLKCAGAPWALNRIKEVLMNEKQVNIDSWTKDFDDHVSKVQKTLNCKAKEFTASKHRITIKDLKEILAIITKDLWQAEVFTNLGYYIVKNGSEASDIINSFYLDDLAMSSAAITAGKASVVLQKYLAQVINTNNRINVEEIPSLQQFLSPRHIPLGRWPSNAGQKLSLMQQAAVNITIFELKNKENIFSVNGPPGTGKTTLLRDLIADIVVQRAEKMIIYANPEEAFTKEGECYRPDNCLTGFEILVASSNNAAVENISLELPSIEGIDKIYQENASYFPIVSESIKINSDNKNTSNSSKKDKTSPHTLKDTTKEQQPHKATWGLIAARLGSMDNCADFCAGFWWDNNASIRKSLLDRVDLEDWNEARQRFSHCKQIVQNIIDQRERWYQKLILQKSASKDLLAAKSYLGEAFADNEWWSRENDELQLSAPWIDQKLNNARTELFLAALNVHEQFIQQSTEPFIHNLSKWVNLVLCRPNTLDDKGILQVWQTFFLVVPVASTTLASMRRLFGRLPTASLGWLLIDEAGQAIPQAAVGALQRTKRAVVVGDPLQVKPVFTQDAELVKDLQNYFGIENHWCPMEASIQTLCDRSNLLGAEIEVDKKLMWIGCPLWVHRRCIKPMVTISNTIAYQGKMVVATRYPQPDKLFPLGDSSWIDVEGKCQEKQWVKFQGDKVVEMLSELVMAEKALPDLYIISPFKKVSSNLKLLLKSNKSLWAINADDSDINKWVDRSVGTVHTFQGKEAGTVIFVLGGDEDHLLALDWASKEPNILNVAATRAKYRMYIVGSHRLWSKLRYFSDASCLLPCKIDEEKFEIEPHQNASSIDRLSLEKIAIKLLEERVSIKVISRSTELSVERIEELQSNLVSNPEEEVDRFIQAMNDMNFSVMLEELRLSGLEFLMKLIAVIFSGIIYGLTTLIRIVRKR